MKSTQTNINDQSTGASLKPYTTDSVTSKDGAVIGYRQLGYGPGVALLHGGFSSAHNHMQLAEALADSFTVYVPDRRGRGLSIHPYGKDDGVQKDVEDRRTHLCSFHGSDKRCRHLALSHLLIKARQDGGRYRVVTE